jgi:hypothetical protein
MKLGKVERFLKKTSFLLSFFSVVESFGKNSKVFIFVPSLKMFQGRNNCNEEFSINLLSGAKGHSISYFLLQKSHLFS